MVRDSDNTYAWLLSSRAACPRCGGDVAETEPTCRACGLSQRERVRPRQRSLTVVMLTGMWAAIAAGAALMAIGGQLSAAGMLPRDDPGADNQIWRSLARVVSLADILELPAATAAPPAPPDWLLPALVGAAIAAAALAYGSWSRAPWGLYAGIGVLSIGVLSGAALALIFRNTPALIIAALCVGGAAALGLSYFAALGEFLGEERRVSYTPHGSSGRELYHEGRGHYAEGRIFLAAQCWARAIGREPGNAAYLHALGLALARLGQRERALAELARAQAAAPDDREIQASYTMVQKGT